MRCCGGAHQVPLAFTTHSGGQAAPPALVRSGRGDPPGKPSRRRHARAGTHARTHARGEAAQAGERAEWRRPGREVDQAPACLPLLLACLLAALGYSARLAGWFRSVCSLPQHRRGSAPSRRLAGCSVPRKAGPRSGSNRPTVRPSVRPFLPQFEPATVTTLSVTERMSPPGLTFHYR